MEDVGTGPHAQALARVSPCGLPAAKALPSHPLHAPTTASGLWSASQDSQPASDSPPEFFSQPAPPSSPPPLEDHLNHQHHVNGWGYSGQQQQQQHGSNGAVAAGPPAVASSPAGPRSVKGSVHDPVHGAFDVMGFSPRFTAVLRRLVRSQQFKRLDRLKQLGAVPYAGRYRSAEHTRLPHSLGVFHVARRMVEALFRGQPELRREFADKAGLVLVAALCHDFGHGPGCHMFEHMAPMLDIKDGDGRKWCHERMSCVLLKEALGPGALEAWELEWVEAMIRGRDMPTDAPSTEAWLFQIVSNAQHGADVDKMDYLLRDAHMTGVKISFTREDLDLIIDSAKVDGDGQLCFHRRAEEPLWHLFQSRKRLHAEVYQNPATTAAELVMSDALVLAVRSGALRLELPGGRDMDVPAAAHDPDGFMLLHDGLWDRIRESTDPRLAEARAMLSRLYGGGEGHHRSCGLHVLLPNEWQKLKLGQVLQHAPPSAGIRESDIVLRETVVNCGKECQYPLKNVRFYDDSGDAWTAPVPQDQRFQERHLRLYLRNHAQHAAAREALRGYARAHWHEGLALGCDDGDDDGDDAAEGMGVEEAVRAGSPGSQKATEPRPAEPTLSTPDSKRTKRCRSSESPDA